MADELKVASDAGDVKYWSSLVDDPADIHTPNTEIPFPAFCEALVRIAASR